MISKKASVSSKTLRRLFSSIHDFLKSEVGGKAKLFLFALISLMLGINGLNVLNSYVGCDFMSAIASRNSAGFVHYAWIYLAVFAASTLTAALFRLSEERLGLLWREWLTRRITDSYINRQLYLEIEGDDNLSNPDQRITEDIKLLTTSTLSFLLLIFNGTLTVLSFSGVLWAISPKLFLIAVAYASIGSSLAIWLGRPLIQLNYRQADFEANFRTELIHTREEAKNIIAADDEQNVRKRLNRHIDKLVKNYRLVISINRNLNFFTGGYNSLIQLIPALIVAPLFIQGNVEFGVIGQSTMAFATLLGAFSLVISQFQAISSYAVVISRLDEFIDFANRREHHHPQIP